MTNARAVSVSTVGMTKRFGTFTALADVSIDIPAGAFHVLLGENGAGKSTLVKCIMGYYQPDSGSLLVDGKPVTIRTPRDARALGIGMVYQHFTLVPSLTGAENLVINRADTPAVINWKAERERLETFMARVPFRVPLDRPVASLAAGEKQKLEIIKLLYLDGRFLILDEPTSVLTPGEADEILGLLKDMTARGELSILMISHKFREVTAFADAVSVLRRGALVGGGRVADMTTDAMARMMIGHTAAVSVQAARVPMAAGETVLDIAGLVAEDDAGRLALDGVNLKVKSGEIVGIAGVSGNGQAALVETLSGQRALRDGRVTVHGQNFEAVRRDFDRFRVFGLPEEPLKNAAVPRMSVAENIAFRSFDKPPLARFGWMSAPALRERAAGLVERYGVKTASLDAPIATLSGGNVQRAVLARELSGEVDVLIVANPCFGLDFASVAEIRGQIMAQRNRGAAVLLVSEDLDEILELADRVAVMSEGRIVHTALIGQTDRTTIGHHMAGH